MFQTMDIVVPPTAHVVAVESHPPVPNFENYPQLKSPEPDYSGSAMMEQCWFNMAFQPQSPMPNKISYTQTAVYQMLKKISPSFFGFDFRC